MVAINRPARRFVAADVPELLILMKGLAQFEGYIDDFRVREADLVRHGLGPQPIFDAWVVDDGVGLLGMAVTYVVPWTYTRYPRLVLKELFVKASARGRGVGKVLLQRVASEALERGCDSVQWTVLKSNAAADRFYRQHGGLPDETWDLWNLQGEALNRLAADDNPTDGAYTPP
ncbi:MAG: GNAT family N-acetyltransferase [Myxococcota bacterium]